MSKKNSSSFQRLALGALVCLAVSGCAGKAPADPELCDGSEGLVLRVFYAGGGQQLSGQQMQTENGYGSFAVDGQCHYFIGGGWDVGARHARDQEWREGILDDELSGSLQRMIGGSDLSGLGPCGRYDIVLDAPSLFISSADSTFTCGGGTERAQAVVATIRQYSHALRTGGQPLAGDLYIKVMDGALADFAVDWPDSIPLPEVEPDYNVSGRVVISAADAAPVRALRDRWLQGSASRTYWDTGIPVRKGERLARVFLRDALPYEDPSGRLPLPPLL